MSSVCGTGSNQLSLWHLPTMRLVSYLSPAQKQSFSFSQPGTHALLRFDAFPDFFFSCWCAKTKVTPNNLRKTSTNFILAVPKQVSFTKSTATQCIFLLHDKNYLTMNKKKKKPISGKTNKREGTSFMCSNYSKTLRSLKLCLQRWSVCSGSFSIKYLTETNILHVRFCVSLRSCRCLQITTAEIFISMRVVIQIITLSKRNAIAAVTIIAISSSKSWKHFFWLTNFSKLCSKMKWNVTVSLSWSILSYSVKKLLKNSLLHRHQNNGVIWTTKTNTYMFADGKIPSRT